MMDSSQIENEVAIGRDLRPVALGRSKMVGTSFRIRCAHALALQLMQSLDTKACV